MSTVRHRKNNTENEEAVTPIVEEETKTKTEAAKEAKKRTWITRTWTTLLMVSMFFGLIYLGHLTCVAFIVLLLAGAFKELEHVFFIAKPELSATHSIKGTSWSLFFLTMYFSVWRIIYTTFPEQIFSVDAFALLAKYHYIICFGVYCFIFVTFVLKLESGKYREQIYQFAWTHLLMLYALFQASFWVACVFRGLYWLLFPASLVIVNDVFAFVFGSLMGRTPLIKLSPKKTWEGFIGGAFSTFVWAIFFGWVLMKFPWLTCPKTDLYTWNVTCTVDPVFVPRTYNLFGHDLSICPVHIYGLIMAAFASFVAPFGGFFASGIKRAFEIKDFANLIPGHGGITDRMDCQFLMGLFTYLFVSAFVGKNDTGSFVASFLAMDEDAKIEALSRIKDIVA